jgi:serine protease Do
LSKLRPARLDRGDKSQADPRHGPAQEKPELALSALQTSGFFVSPDGYIVASHEAVEDAAQIQITTESNETLPARVVGDDPTSGLALLKIDGHEPFAYAEFKTGKARAGDWIVAIGNPFGIGLTVTAGIIAGSVSRSRSPKDLVELDIPSNIGDAGSPAFDMDGKVAAVAAALSPPQGSAGVAFAIPAATVRQFVRRVMVGG